MRFTSASAVIFFIAALFGQPVNSQDIIWGKQLGSDKEEYVLSHVVDDKGNIYVSGRTNGNIDGNNSGQNDAFLIRLDKSGNVLWSRQFGSSGNEDVQWSATDRSGNIYLTGYTTGMEQNSGKEDIIIVKYTAEGEQAWLKLIGTDSTDIAKGICTDGEGNIYITGLTGGKLGESSYGKLDCFLIKLDDSGNILKSVQFGTPMDDLCYSVTKGINHDIFVCGTTWGDISGESHGAVDSFTGHFTSSLENPGFHQFGTDGFDIALVVHSDSKNDLLVAGSTSGNFASAQAGEGDCFLLKINNEGSIVWMKQFGTNHNDGIRGIEINASDKVFVSGIMNLPPEKAFIRTYSKDGDLLWEKLFEVPGIEGGTSGKDILIDNEGNLTHLGLTKVPLFGPVRGDNDAYIVKLKLK